jgi:hypothetical protein
LTAITINKMEAAQRQLRTAITLWFDDSDPVSVHTLAFAAYEILHAVSEYRDPHRCDLIFDTFLIKDEFRREWNKLIRRDANFFKHAERDPEASLDFDPAFSEWFILYATVARQLCGREQSNEETLFLWWFQINRPDFLTENGRKVIADRIPADVLANIRALTKGQFREGWRLAKITGMRPIVQMS